MMKRRTTFATRLFFALFLLSAVPAAALIGLATWGLTDYVQLTGDAGAWGRVGETGGELLAEIEDAAPDSALTAAADAHEAQLSRSITQSRRFDLVASRLADLLPWLALVLGTTLAAVAIWASRMLTLQLASPVAQIVDWADRLAREQPLPPPEPGDDRGAEEFRALRVAFRRMAEQLDAGRRGALEAERLRTWSEMARRVAHEIKNPLTPLGFALRAAGEALARDDREAAAENLEVIREETSRLDEIARSFAQLGKLPEGPTSEIDLEELLSSLLASDLPAGVSGEMTAEGPSRIVGNLTALTRVFRNLLGNAVEALNERGEGRIEVTLLGGDGEVEILIVDDGPGIPPEGRDRIWDPDFTTRKRGTGIGLALVRQTVRAHGGEVELRDVERGACFAVRLPVGGAGLEMKAEE